MILSRPPLPGTGQRSRLRLVFHGSRQHGASQVSGAVHSNRVPPLSAWSTLQDPPAAAARWARLCSPLRATVVGIPTPLSLTSIARSLSTETVMVSSVASACRNTLLTASLTTASASWARVAGTRSSGPVIRTVVRSGASTVRAVIVSCNLARSCDASAGSVCRSKIATRMSWTTSCSWSM